MREKSSLRAEETVGMTLKVEETEQIWTQYKRGK